MAKGELRSPLVHPPLSGLSSGDMKSPALRVYTRGSRITTRESSLPVIAPLRLSLGCA